MKFEKGLDNIEKIFIKILRSIQMYYQQIINQNNFKNNNIIRNYIN